MNPNADAAPASPSPKRHPSLSTSAVRWWARACWRCRPSSPGWAGELPNHYPGATFSQLCLERNRLPGHPLSLTFDLWLRAAPLRPLQGGRQDGDILLGLGCHWSGAPAIWAQASSACSRPPEASQPALIAHHALPLPRRPHLHREGEGEGGTSGHCRGALLCVAARYTASGGCLPCSGGHVHAEQCLAAACLLLPNTSLTSHPSPTPRHPSQFRSYSTSSSCCPAACWPWSVSGTFSWGEAWCDNSGWMLLWRAAGMHRAQCPRLASLHAAPGALEACQPAPCFPADCVNGVEHAR